MHLQHPPCAVAHLQRRHHAALAAHAVIEVRVRQVGHAVLLRPGAGHVELVEFSHAFGAVDYVLEMSGEYCLL